MNRLQSVGEPQPFPSTIKPMLATLVDKPFHADLGAYHILTDRRNARINGVVDFGTAGLGDPASDLGMVINQLGERFVARMSKYYPGVPDLIGRARFKAGALELEWALNGIMNNDRSWFMAHVGQARDAMPIESGWPG